MPRSPSPRWPSVTASACTRWPPPWERAWPASTALDSAPLRADSRRVEHDRRTVAVNEIAGRQTWKRDGLKLEDWLTPLPDAAIAELETMAERLRRDPRPVESLAPED